MGGDGSDLVWSEIVWVGIGVRVWVRMGMGVRLRLLLNAHHQPLPSRHPLSTPHHAPGISPPRGLRALRPTVGYATPGPPQSSRRDCDVIATWLLRD